VVELVVAEKLKWHRMCNTRVWKGSRVRNLHAVCKQSDHFFRTEQWL